MEVYIYIGLICCLIQTTYGLQCSKCRNITLDSSTPSSDKLLLSTFDETYSTGDCAGSQSANLETCADEMLAGKIKRCGQLIGNLRLSIDTRLIGHKIEFAVNVHMTECFTVDSTLTSGCSSNADTLQQPLNALSQVFKDYTTLQVGRFNGKICVQSLRSNQVGNGFQNNNMSPPSKCSVYWAVIFVLLYLCLFC